MMMTTKSMSKLVLAMVALGSCVAASAQTYSSDEERRARNREEAIANWERTHDRDGTPQRSDMQPRKGVRETTHETAQKTRSFTHRQLDKVRNFGERQQRRHPRPANATPESDKAPAAIGK
jgi:hypothetical protein